MINISPVEANINENHKDITLHVLKNVLKTFYIYNFCLVTEYLNHNTNKIDVSSYSKT